MKKLLLLFALFSLLASAQDAPITSTQTAENAPQVEQGKRPQLFIILLDRTGSIRTAVHNATKQNSYRADSYVDGLFHGGPDGSENKGQLFAWLRSLESAGVKLDLENDQAWLVPYGFMGSYGDWKQNYIENLGSQSFDQAFSKANQYWTGLVNGSQGGGKYGLTTVAKSWTLYQLRELLAQQRYERIFLLTLTDTDRNAGGGGDIGLTELQVLRRYDAAEDSVQYDNHAAAQYAMDQVQKNYSFSNPPFNVFFPLKPPTAGYRPYSEYGTDYNARLTPLGAELLEVLPSSNPSNDNFYVFEEAVQLEYTAEGFRGEAKVLPRTLSEGPFRWLDLRLTAQDPNGERIVDRWHLADSQAFNISFDLPRSLSDWQNKTELKITTRFDYIPDGFDIGLTYHQEVQNPLKKPESSLLPKGPGLFNQTVRLNHELMARHPDKSQAEVKAYYKGWRLFWDIFVLVIAATILAAIGFWIVKRLRRFPPPKLKTLFYSGNSDGTQLSEPWVFKPIEQPLQVVPGSNLNKYLLGTIQLSNEAGTNRFGDKEQLVLTYLRVSVEECEPKTVKAGKQALLLGNAATLEREMLSEHRDWQIVLNPSALTGLEKSDFKEGLLKLKAKFEYKVAAGTNHSPSLFAYPFLILLEVDPCAYQFETTWIPGPQFLIKDQDGRNSCEYDHFKEPIKAGTLRLIDKTPAYYRLPASLNVSAEILKLPPNRTDRKDELLRFDYLDLPLAHWGTPIEQMIHGNLDIGVLIDPRALKPIQENVDFEALFLVDDSGKEKNINKREVAISFHQNNTESNLIVRHQLDGFPCLLQTGAKPPINSGKPFVNRRQLTSALVLKLELENSAKVLEKNAKGLALNLIAIKKCQLICGSSGGQDFSSLLYYEININETLSSHGDVVEIQPGTENRAVFAVKLRFNADPHIFEYKNQEWVLHIDYEHWLRTEKRHVVDSFIVHLNFKIQPDLGTEALAIDFGTCAIAMAHSYLEGEKLIKELIPIGEIWKRQNLNYNPAESNHNFLVSALILKNDNKWEVGHEDRKVVSRTDRRYFPYIKTFVGACKRYYGYVEGGFEIKELVETAYQKLKENYIDKQRDQLPLLKHLIVTHPNSYLWGQVDFLKRRLRSVFGGKMAISPLSESDAALYQFLKRRDRSGQLPKVGDGQEELILCIDMGAGTVDFSLRAFLHQEDKETGEETLASGTRDGGRLLGMASVHGAGSYLDQVLAALVAEKIAKLNRVARDISPDAGDFISSMPFFSRDEKLDVVTHSRALLDFHQKLVAAKVSWDGYSDFCIPIVGKLTDKEIIRLIAIDRNQWNRLHEEHPDIELKQKENSFALEIPPHELWAYLKTHYLENQVFLPLRAILEREDGSKEALHTVVLSGRAIQFPGFTEIIQDWLSRFLPFQKPCFHGIAEEMKSGVVLGALEWGLDSSGSETLMETPRMHGVVGFAYLRAGKWLWKPLLNQDAWNSEEVSRRRKVDDKIRPRSCSIMLVLHTMIRNPELVIELLEEKVPKEPSMVRSHLKNTGLFQELHYFDDFALYRNEEFLRFEVFVAKPSEAAISEEIDPDSDYLNMRINLKIHFPNGSVLEVSKAPIALGSSMDKVWPFSIYEHR